MLQLTASTQAVVFSSRARARFSGLCNDRNAGNNADRHSGRPFSCHGMGERDSNRFRRCYSSTSSELRRDRVEQECLVRVYGWEVRRLNGGDGDEMRQVARIQAEAFHEPSALFDDLFFQFFQAEVLSGLLYKLRNSPPDRYIPYHRACVDVTVDASKPSCLYVVPISASRYACLVAEPAAAEEEQTELVGVVDVTVLRDDSVVQHLQGDGEEYLYVSGIAVSESFRRQKVATALLEACDVLSSRWGYQYLALRAYEDDVGARKLYSNAGYNVVGSDPVWVTLIGKKRRVLMIKKI